MSKLKAHFLKIYFRLVRSIAFLPMLIMLIFGVLSFILIALHETQISTKLLGIFPWIRIDSADRAGLIVTTLLAGVISLTVFSFSMVMLVINQASTQFTPRIINYITENLGNQVVLGFYLGTILYYVILLISFTKRENTYVVPDIAFGFSVLCGIISLILFVRFIHSISLTVQVTKIIKLVYRKVKKRLEFVLEQKHKLKPEDVVFDKGIKWHIYPAHGSGYFQSVLEDILPLLKDNDLLMRIDAEVGEYVLQGNGLFALNKPVNDALENRISEFFVFYSTPQVAEHSHYGFIQLTEIACKALSPGINDPGTAKTCIDYLTDLFRMRSCVPDVDYMVDSENNLCVIIKPHTYQSILQESFTPIRQYGQNDVQVLRQLLNCLYKLAKNDITLRQHVLAYNFNADAIVTVAAQNISNYADKQYFNETILQLQTLDDYFNIQVLS